MRTKKLLGIGLGSLLLLSLVGFGTAAAAQHQTEAEPPISLEKEASSVPIGISEYQLSKVLPKEIESSLPSIEEIEKSLKAITGE